MKEKTERTNHRFSRRKFIKAGAGAAIAAGCLPALNLQAQGSGAEASVTHRSATKIYICPPCGQPCDKLTFDKPGNCPQCGMKLVPQDGEGGPPKVAILLFNGAEIIDFAGPWEVFGTAGFLVHTVADSLEPHIMVFGQKVVPDYTFDDSPKADILLIPGGGYGQANSNDRLIDWLKKKSQEARYVMSVCTGAFILGKAGLLSGQTATCTYGMVEDLAAFPNTKVVYDARYVDSGKIITTAGLSSGIDGAIYLVSKMLGKGAAQSAALGVEYRWDPNSVWARGALADRYLPDGLAFGNARIKGAEAELISTEGTAEQWETKLRLSEPNTLSRIVDLLRERITNNSGMGGMNNRISHIRSGPTLIGNGREAEIRWKFTDDNGRNWLGTGLVEPAPDDKSKFVVTLRLARATHA